MFNNTEIAFRIKNNRQLKRAVLLFRIINKPWLVEIGTKLLTHALKLHLPVVWLIRRTVFNHFCGGESLADCIPVINEMGLYNVYSIPDYSSEGFGSENSFNNTTKEVLECIRLASSNKNIGFAVFKPTGIIPGPVLEAKQDLEFPYGDRNNMIHTIGDRLDLICKEACDNGIQVLIDAEDYCYQDTIDLMTENLMKRFNRNKAIIFITVQMYRHDRLPFLERLISNARGKGYFIGVKLVRGAYLEKERERASVNGYASPVFDSKAKTDKAYDDAIEFLCKNLDICSIMCATHNEASTMNLVEFVNRSGMNRDDQRIWFAQLYGMSDTISFNLAENGYNVAKYLPYGPVKLVIPYLIRRAEENTSIAGQTGRELEILLKETKRRKNDHR